MQVATDAPDALRLLWKAKFLLNEKTMPEIAKKLQDLGYNFPANTLSMALGKAKFLTRKGSRGTYTFVQRYPFTAEDLDGKG